MVNRCSCRMLYTIFYYLGLSWVIEVYTPLSSIFVGFSMKTIQRAMEVSPSAFRASSKVCRACSNSMGYKWHSWRSPWAKGSRRCSGAERSVFFGNPICSMEDTLYTSFSWFKTTSFWGESNMFHHLHPWNIYPIPVDQNLKQHLRSGAYGNGAPPQDFPGFEQFCPGCAHKRAQPTWAFNHRLEKEYDLKCFSQETMDSGLPHRKVHKLWKVRNHVFKSHGYGSRIKWWLFNDWPVWNDSMQLLGGSSNGVILGGSSK